MRWIRLSLVLFMIVILAACQEETTIYNFQQRKDSYLINEDKTVIVEYKTNEDGLLVEILMDRLLTVEDMIYYNTTIDYDVTLEGFSGDIFVSAGFLCTDYDELIVPINIEVGNTRLKYDVGDCEYVEVDRDNEPKEGRFVRRYELDETIDVSRDTIVSIVVFDESSIERFIEIQQIPHTMKNLGVYSVGLNYERDDFSGDVILYYRDVAVFEQLLLKHQESEAAIYAANGINESINLLELGDVTEIIPLIDEFEIRYEDEINAFEELVDLIGIVSEEVEGETNEEPTQE